MIKKEIFYGVTMQINLDDDYSQKAQELDKFFMKAFYTNKKEKKRLFMVMINMEKEVYGKEFSKNLIG